jgi:hypothetical protein
MTPDGKSAVTMEANSVSNIWVSTNEDISRLEQITFGESPLYGATEIDHGQILVPGSAEIWILEASGAARASFAKLHAAFIRKCGKFVVARVWRDGAPEIVRFDNDGTNSASLAKGAPLGPSCSPDGKFVFYVDLTLPQRIFRVPIEGGTPVEIAKIPGDGPAGNVEVANNGKLLAFIWDQYKPAPTMYLSVISSTKGSLVKTFSAPAGVYDVRWSADDSALQYILTQNGVGNLWEQPYSGGPPRQLTKFTSGQIFSFNWSTSHKRLLLVRGSVTSDVVLLTNLR